MTYENAIEKYDLDISVVNFKNLAGSFRIDAEYYKPEYLKIEKKIKTKNNNLLFPLIIKFGSGKNLTQTPNGKYRFLRTQNVRQVLNTDNGLSNVNEINNLDLLKLLELSTIVRKMGLQFRKLAYPHS